MQLPQAAKAALCLLTDPDTFANDFKTFLPRFRIDEDDTDLSFDADRLDMVWWEADSPPLAENHSLIPLEELWNKATKARRVRSSGDRYPVQLTATRQTIHSRSHIPAPSSLSLTHGNSRSPTRSGV